MGWVGLLWLLLLELLRWRHGGRRRSSSGAVERPAAYATLERSRPGPFTQIDSALALLACQLLMLGGNEEGRELLLRTGEAPIEEYCDRPEGEFWARYRPEDGGVPVGENANGQNLMHLRTLLRTSAPADLTACGARLLGELGPALVGKAVMSELSATFYAEESTTYADVLERAAPSGRPRGAGVRGERPVRSLGKGGRPGYKRPALTC